MEAMEILNYIPKERMEFLALQTKVDYKAKKLDGITLFQLFLYSMVTERRSSLQVMEEIFSSFNFQNLPFKTKHKSVKFNSISERLNIINPDFFEKLFEECYTRFHGYFKNEKTNIIRYDSTLVSVSSKLLDYMDFVQVGIRATKNKLNLLLDWALLLKAPVFSMNPDITTKMFALKEIILNDKHSPEEIIVFDRVFNPEQHMMS
jgi:hypothetical protein